MYPNSPYAMHDEPTMTDLRGILPGQRPPIDATVLDEPTSEVPIIRPAREPEPEPEPAPAEPEARTEIAETETESAAEAEAEVASAGEPAPEPVPETPEAPRAEAAVEADEPAAEAAPPETEEPAAEAALPETEEPAAEPVSPMATPPVVPRFGTDIRSAEPPRTGSEMAKMSWAPPAATVPPPGLVPSSPGGVFEPSPPPPVTEPEPVAPAPANEFAPLSPVIETTDPEPVPAPVDELATPAVKTTGPEPVEEPVPAFGAPATEAVVVDTPEAEVVTGAPAVEPQATEPALTEEPEPELIEEPEPELIEEPELELIVEPEPVQPEPAAAAGTEPAPGDVAETPVSLWSDEAAARLRNQWRDLQVDFVDNPHAAVEGAKQLVSDAVRKLADTLLDARDELDPFRGGDRVDTESMRVAMRSYREFLDRVLAL